MGFTLLPSACQFSTGLFRLFWLGLLWIARIQPCDSALSTGSFRCEHDQDVETRSRRRRKLKLVHKLSKGHQDLKLLGNVHLGLSFCFSCSRRALTSDSSPKTCSSGSQTLSSLSFQSSSPMALPSTVLQQWQLLSGYSGINRSMKELCWLALISWMLQESGQMMEIFWPRGLRVSSRSLSTGQQQMLGPSSQLRVRWRGLRERMESSPEVHLEIPFIFAWSCQPKHLLAGIIRKASVNSLEALRMMAVISGMGGSSLKAYSTRFSFIFQSQSQSIWCSLESANSRGDLVAIMGEIFSTSAMNSLRLWSSFSSLCSFFSESIFRLLT